MIAAIADPGTKRAGLPGVPSRGTGLRSANDGVMGDGYASLTLLTDAIGAVQNFVTVFIAVYLLLIFVYVLASWFRVPDSLRPLMRFLHDVCDPYLRLFRRIVPPLGPVDVSPIIAVGGLFLLEWLINSVLLENLR